MGLAVKPNNIGKNTWTNFCGNTRKNSTFTPGVTLRLLWSRGFVYEHSLLRSTVATSSIITPLPGLLWQFFAQSISHHGNPSGSPLRRLKSRNLTTRRTKGANGFRHSGTFTTYGRIGFRSGRRLTVVIGADEQNLSDGVFSKDPLRITMSIACIRAAPRSNRCRTHQPNGFGSTRSPKRVGLKVLQK